jgi:hypothetical protein
MEPRKKIVTREAMITAIKVAERNNTCFDDEVEEFLDDHDAENLQQLATTLLRKLYNNIPAQLQTKQEKKEPMEKFTADAFADRKTRTISITIEDKDGLFLTSDGTRHERALGGEVPIYTKMPQEVYEAIIKQS